MSLTPGEIAAAEICSSAIKNIIESQLLDIDKYINASAPRLGVNVVEYKLPSSFSIDTTLSGQDLQLIVYSKILESLMGRGFDVKIMLETVGQAKSQHMLFIRWESHISETERKKMIGIINSHLLARRDLPNFKRGDGFVATQKGTQSKPVEPDKEKDENK
jgi:hypothetical protein